MPDNTNADTILLTPDGASISPSTAGALLKAARQQAGLHLAVLSVNLKVPVRQLEALEADQYPADQSPVFARALAASMCRQLRVDPAPVLALMPMSANYLEPHGAVRQAYVAPADLGRVRRASTDVPTKAWWAAGAMLVLIAVLIWAPHPAQWAWLHAVTAAVASPEPEPKSEPVTNVTAAAAQATPQNAPVITDPSLSGGQGGPVPLPMVIPGTAGMPAAASVPVATSAAPVPELIFSALNTSWIEVRDSQNQLLWNGVLNTGDSKRVQAPQPVSVVVGRADAIQVSFKGQPLDLIPHTKVNVARFEVKP
jgi:cytoskeleton protein RodZ